MQPRIKPRKVSELVKTRAHNLVSARNGYAVQFRDPLSYLRGLKGAERRRRHLSGRFLHLSSVSARRFIHTHTNRRDYMATNNNDRRSQALLSLHVSEHVIYVK